MVHRGGDVYGDGVNIASRIEPLAGAGGICVSMDVERQIRNAVETRFEKLAPTELKNISVPMDLFRIVLPWEEAEVGCQRSDWIQRSEEKPASVRSFNVGLGGGWAVLLLLIGIGWWWVLCRINRWQRANNLLAARAINLQTFLKNRSRFCHSKI